MTYQELFDKLKQIKKHSPEKMLDEVVFVDRDVNQHPVSFVIQNDTSMQNMKPYTYFLSEV